MVESDKKHKSNSPQANVLSNILLPNGSTQAIGKHSCNIVKQLIPVGATGTFKLLLVFGVS